MKKEKKVKSPQKKKIKSLGKRMVRLVMVVVLVIFSLSTYMNWNFMRAGTTFMLSMNGVIASNYARVFLGKQQGLPEYVRSVLETYRSVPEDVRQNPHSETYRAYFEPLKDNPYYQSIIQDLTHINDVLIMQDAYLITIDKETMARISLVEILEEDEDDSLGIGEWAPVTEEDIQKLEDTKAYYYDEKENISDLASSFDLKWEKGDRKVSIGVPFGDDYDNLDCYVITDVSYLFAIVPAILFEVVYFILMGLSCIIIFFVARWIVRKRIVHPIRAISQAVESYSESRLKGNTEEESFALLDIRTKDELQELSHVMAAMEKDIENYEKDLIQAAEERQKITTELTVATGIQTNIVPNQFPPFPDHKEFSLYASMDQAKEVGGDFYDFYMIDDQHLGLLIADVSGKGIPAALFMMSSMIMIRDLALSGCSPAKLLEKTNERICRSNKLDMFVTVWFGILDIENGVITAANAGHEYPAIRQPGGKYELFHDKHGFVVGGMEGVRYKEYTIKLEPGASLFVYTDGVAEATNAHDELYGTKRMLDAVNQVPDASCERILQTITDDVAQFVGEATQFDDLTMLCLTYHGQTFLPVA